MTLWSKHIVPYIGVIPLKIGVSLYYYFLFLPMIFKPSKFPHSHFFIQNWFVQVLLVTFFRKEKESLPKLTSENLKTLKIHYIYRFYGGVSLKLIMYTFLNRKNSEPLWFYSYCLRNNGFQIFGCEFGEWFLFISWKKSPVKPWNIQNCCKEEFIEICFVSKILGETCVAPDSTTTKTFHVL